MRAKAAPNVVSDGDERWEVVGAAIAARIHQLGLTKAQAAREAGLSETSLTAYMRERPIKRVGKSAGLCRALGWPTDAVDRMLDGGEPPTAVAEGPRDLGRFAGVPRAVLEVALLIDELSPEGRASVVAYIQFVRSNEKG